MKMKYRYELKYTVNDTDALWLKEQLKYLMTVDANAKSADGSYRICSLYFDTPDQSAYYEKIDGVLNRRKFRIRYYDDDASFLRLEKKMKHNNMTAKQQAVITQPFYKAILDGHAHLWTAENPLIKEFISLLAVERLVPSVVVAYRRLAYTYPVSDVRVTFDSRIQTGRYDVDPLRKQAMMYDVLPPHTQVLEVKFNETLPASIASVIAGIPLCREAVSKFARCAAWK